MGISLWKPSYAGSPAPNPNPSNFKVLDWRQYGAYAVLIVHYPDATNFEGKKVLVYRGDAASIAVKSTLDPHFFPDDEGSPLARFKPDKEGVENAVHLAQYLDNKHRWKGGNR